MINLCQLCGGAVVPEGETLRAVRLGNDLRMHLEKPVPVFIETADAIHGGIGRGRLSDFGQATARKVAIERIERPDTRAYVPSGISRFS